MTAPAIKSVTKAVLSGFVREHTSLNLTQSKALTDQLLAEYIVTVKPPPDPSTVPVEPGQLWLHTGSERVLRVTDVELGPMYVPGDPVTSWGPQSVSWQNPDDATATGITEIHLWREQMRLIPSPRSTFNLHSNLHPRKREPLMSDPNTVPAPKLYALVSKQGTAMSETVLTEDEFTAQNRRQTKAEAPADWDGGDFHDVSDNDALRDVLDDMQTDS